MKSKAVAAGMEGKEHEVADSRKTQPQPARAPSLQAIQQRAYELHLEQGCVHGRDLDDWLQAERELRERYQAG
jgi:Protein of unknown function (DUF2934)